jgi:hypothetical protein
MPLFTLSPCISYVASGGIAYPLLVEPALVSKVVCVRLRVALMSLLDSTGQDDAVASVLVTELTGGLEYEYPEVYPILEVAVEDSTGKEVAVASVLVEMMDVEREELSDAEGVKELSLALAVSEVSDLDSLLEDAERVDEEGKAVVSEGIAKLPVLEPIDWVNEGVPESLEDSINEVDSLGQYETLSVIGIGVGEVQGSDGVGVKEFELVSTELNEKPNDRDNVDVTESVSEALGLLPISSVEDAVYESVYDSTLDKLLTEEVSSDELVVYESNEEESDEISVPIVVDDSADSVGVYEAELVLDNLDMV